MLALQLANCLGVPESLAKRVDQDRVQPVDRLSMFRQPLFDLPRIGGHQPTLPITAGLAGSHPATGRLIS